MGRGNPNRTLLLAGAKEAEQLKNWQDQEIIRKGQHRSHCKQNYQYFLFYIKNPKSLTTSRMSTWEWIISFLVMSGAFVEHKKDLMDCWEESQGPNYLYTHWVHIRA